MEGRDQDSAVFALRRDCDSMAKYSIPADMWDLNGMPANSPLSAQYSADRYGDTIFALGRVGMQSAIAMYDIALNQWSTPRPVPSGSAENGGIFARHRDTAYVLLSGTPPCFYRHIVPTNTWTPLAPPMGLTGLASSSYDGSNLIHVLEVQSGTPTRGLLATYSITLGRWSTNTGDTLYALQSMCGTAITTVPGRSSIFALWPTPIGTPYSDSTNCFEFNLSDNLWHERCTYLDSIGPYPSMTSTGGLPYASCLNTTIAQGQTFGRYYPATLGLLAEGVGEAMTAPVSEYGLKAEPNPFTRSTTIRWQAPKATNAKVAVYDVQGRLVKDLRSGDSEAGHYSQVWDTQAVPAGVYLCSFTSSERRMTQRLILMK